MLQQHPLYSYLPARDVARARRFYEEVLGFTPGETTGGGVTYRFAGGTACFLYPTPHAGTSQASQAFWEVGDIRREKADLEARGVVFERIEMPGGTVEDGVFVGGGAKAAWFKDSEGNILALVQTL
ncbi:MULTISPECIES: VOC family protein [Luteimonas]|uniref:VOC family protein n=1 Tax=Luteimonas TaxID=83614 RepID=UPI000C7AD9B1|nr:MULTISPECIES: VOC family protein [Luteimonas]